MIPILSQVVLPLNSKAVLIKQIGSLQSPSPWRRGKLKKLPNGLSNISVCRSLVITWSEHSCLLATPEHIRAPIASPGC